MSICKARVERRYAEQICVNSDTRECNYYEMYLFEGIDKKGQIPFQDSALFLDGYLLHARYFAADDSLCSFTPDSIQYNKKLKDCSKQFEIRVLWLF